MNKLISMVICGLAAWSAAAATIGYWPMNVTTEGSKRYVKDISGNGYDFTVRAEADGGSTFVANDIGWSQNLPPNPDFTGDDAKSVQMLQSSNENKTSDFNPVLLNTKFGARLSYENEFTLEGWFRVKQLPSLTITASNKFVIAIDTLANKGGWSWYMQSTKDGSGNLTGCKFAIDYHWGDNSGDRTAKDIATLTLAETERLTMWNHYALVCRKVDAENAEFGVYLNGRQYGTLKVPAVSGTGLSSFFLDGAGSSSGQQAMLGDLTCWRASDEALRPGEFLCDVPNEKTVAYWPMRSTAFSADKPVVASAIRPWIDLTLRKAELGGVSFAANDIGWQVPPNPGREFDPSSPVWQCDTKLQADSGEKDGTQYRPVFTSSDPVLLAALTPTNGFCVEGWYKPSALPETSSKNHMFVYQVLGKFGGWCWNLLGADANGNCAIKVEVAANQTSPSSRTHLVLASVPAAELDGKWNHYALVYDASQCLWRFHLNGSLRGAVKGPEVSGVSYGSGSSFFLFGCGSSTAQIPTGSSVSWRVSRAALRSSEFLCGTAEDALVWTGEANATWSTGTEANWKDRIRATSCSWLEYARAVIDGTSETAEITLGGKVNPETLTVDIDRNVKIVGASNKGIDVGCREITKTGSGTLWFYSLSSGLNVSANDIHVREGTLRATSPNGRQALGNGNTEKGYSVYVYGGAKLWADQRNTLGTYGLTEVNNSHFTVYTNGVFDLTHSTDDGNSFNTQSIGTLELLGGSLVLPTVGHSSGCLQVRDRVVFGCNPTKTPYVFNPAATKNDTLVWQIGSNTVFQVEDITGDSAADVTFNNHLLARTAWETDASHPTPCRFHKTGAGTMVLAQSTAVSTDAMVPSAGVSVEEGELRVNCDYETAFSVASGAALSGSGTIASAVFADGAGLRGELGSKATLTVTGDCTLGRTGTIALANPGKGPVRRMKLLSVNGTLTGGENLKDWTLTVDGQPTKDAVIMLSGNDVVVHSTAGIVIIVR